MRKKKIFGLLIIVALFMFLFGCENLNQGSGNGKEVPVYQGMEVTGTLENQKACNTPLLFSSGGDDEGDGINQQNPFNKNTGEMIEDELKNELGTGTSESAEYYTSKNQDFYITIKLSNPDDFVILSFNLNGVRYASYQFHDNSDLENIILKVNSGDVSGIKEYTIDEIKYVDGTEIKDVIFAGDRTVKVGVTYDAIPDAAISNLKIESTSISLNAQVSDLSNLIDLYESPLKIYLYDGNKLIREKELVVGANEVLFDKLLQNTLYQYAIATRYDSLDGNGSQMVILEKLAFYTNRIIKLTNVDATQESVSFDVVIDDKVEVGSLTAIELYKGNELVKSLEDLTSREFSGLLSNNEYEIRAIYTYNLDDGVDRAVTFTQAVTTKSKTLPRYTSNLERGASSVVLDLTVEDPDSIGKLVSIELYKDNELVECLEDFTEIKFTGLLSNNEYKIVVNFTYDLNEGEGEQPGAMLISFRTKFKNSPYIEIKNVVETKTSIGFEIDIIDKDQVGSLTAIELYKDNELIKSLNDLTLREFGELLSNNEYEIKAVYTYDLNDGFGKRLLTAIHQATTKSKTSPTMEIVDVATTSTSISFDLSIVDLDSILEITNIALLGNGGPGDLQDLNQREITGLLSNNRYELIITYVYDLNDGQEEQMNIAVVWVETLKAEPTLDVVFTHHDKNNVSYEIIVEDPDSVLVLKRVYAKVVVYNGNGGDPNYRQTEEREFALKYLGGINNIDSGSKHKLFIEYTFNLNDGNGNQDITFSKEFETSKQPIGYGLEGDCIETQDSLTFHINEYNYDWLVKKDIKYGLYNSDESVLVSSEFNDENGGLYPYVEDYTNTYTNLLSNSKYILVISYKADLNDGLGDREFVHKLSLTTKPKTAPIIEIVDVVETQTSIGFDFTIEDVDLVGNVTSIEIYKNNELVESLSDLTLREFSGLLSNNLYEIRVGYTYDLNDGFGERLLTATNHATTKSKITPTLQIIDIYPWADVIYFDIQIEDIDAVGMLNNISLYDNNGLVDGLTDLTLRKFSELNSNTDYTIKVKYLYDLNDGVGTRELKVNAEVKTAKMSPIIDVVFVVIDQNTVSYEIIIDDPENSFFAMGSIEARVYENDHHPGGGYFNRYYLSTESMTGILSNLDSGAEHEIFITYAEYIHDIYGDITLTKICKFKTPYLSPGYCVEGFSTHNSINVFIEEVNEDTIDIKDFKVEFYNSDKSILLSNEFNLVREMIWPVVLELNDKYEGLLPNTEYIIVISYKCDLNDGLGEREFIKEFTVKTLEEKIPSIEVVNTIETCNSVSFDILIIDHNNVGSIQSIEIYEYYNNAFYSQLYDLSQREFTNLRSNTAYKIVVTYKYDLNDGNGEQEIKWVTKVTTTL